MTNETPWYENEAELLGIAKCVLDERKAQRLKLGIPDNTAYFAIDGREATLYNQNDIAFYKFEFTDYDDARQTISDLSRKEFFKSEEEEAQILSSIDLRETKVRGRPN